MCRLSNNERLQPWTLDVSKQYKSFLSALPDYVGNHTGPQRNYFAGMEDFMKEILVYSEVSTEQHIKLTNSVYEHSFLAVW